MQTTARRRWVLWFLPPLVVLATLFVAQVVASARYRLDYPLVDDWRYYMPRHAMPTALSLEWVLAPAQDTVHITGKLLDWLVFRYLGHDYNLLATVSLGVFLGSWLIASVAFCFKAASDNRPVLLSALAVFVLALAGAPYWVTLSPYHYLEPVIAYHQMMPMSALAGLALVCVVSGNKPSRAVASGLAALITVAFSLAYSSGAFVLLLFGGTMFVMCALSRMIDRKLERALPALTLVICGTAAFCLALHVLMPMERFRINPVTESRAMPFTSPWRWEFWHFFFALFDRAVLSTATDSISVLRGISIAVIVAVPAVGLFFLIVRRALADEKRTIAIVLLSVLTSILGYAALVSYGRAGFGAYYFPELFEDAKRITVYAHSRFFYWWITAILPLALIAWWLLLERFFSRRVVNVTVVLLALWMLIPKAQLPESYGGYFHHWNYPALYQRDAEEVADLIDRDVQRTRGSLRQSKRYETWRAMDPTKQNPQYRMGETRIEKYRVRKEMYLYARKLQATFVYRWGFARKSS